MNVDLRKHLLTIAVFEILIANYLFAGKYNLSSPDQNINIEIQVDKKVQFSIFYKALIIEGPSVINMVLENRKVLGNDPEVLSTKTNTVKNVIHPVIWEKRILVQEHFNELILKFKDDFGIIFRAFDNGIAYRFFTEIDNDIKIISETAEYTFDSEDTVFFPQETDFFSHNERSYLKRSINELSANSFCSLPVLIQKKNGINILITETDLEDFPGLWLKYMDKNKLSAIHPAYPKKEIQTRDRDVKIEEYEDFIAKTDGTRNYPWRIFAISKDDAGLLNNQLSYILAKPLQIEETDWIKPGKVTWDWWNALNVFGVNFKSGVNTNTYKYYIDFASRYGIEYIILDEGWYELGDLFKVNPDMDLEELFNYAKKKNVEIILWVVWKTLDDQLEEALDQFEKWGVAGIKVDFMQRDDQWMVNYYQKIAIEAAKRKLLVDFHGAYKPAGLRRAYPNVITREGLKGLEHNKWSGDITPTHNLLIPFIRMVAGPMDYTPGATINSQPDSFKINFTRPMGMGTRCHQMAMYVVYESPLQMLADSPSHYYRNLEMTEFITSVPTVWDETVVMHAKVGEYIVMARKSGKNWFIGAMSNESQHNFKIDLSFLDEGEYKLGSFQDGENASRVGIDYKKASKTVTSETILEVILAPSGGWVAKIEK